MQNADVEDILMEVERFRILCVGKSGSGKSSLITRVFRLGPYQPTVQDWTPGEVDIEKEFTSQENKLFALHDSEGFEPGNENSFNTVDRFIRQRREATLPLKDQLHAVWLCIELPTSGQRPFEMEDEKMLQLAHETGTPIMVVFTKYDALLVSKRDALGDIQGIEGAKEVHDSCVQSLKKIVSGMKPPIPEPLHVQVSGRPGYEDTIESLITTTRDLARGQLRVMWEVAPRASLRLKIDGCINNALRGIEIGGIKLDDCLNQVYRNIVAYWNFEDTEKALSSEESEFKDLMLSLVLDVRQPQNVDESHTTTHTASAPPGVATEEMDLFEEWLSNTDLNDEPRVQRVLIAYTADLMTMLKSLFEKVTRPSSSESPRITKQALKEVYEAHKLSDHPRIRLRVWEDVQDKREIPGRDEEYFRRLLRQLLGREPVSPPDRPDPRVKIEGCIDNALDGISSGIELRDCLAKIHQNIVTCWNFDDKDKALNSNVFKQSMLCLVQDIQPQNRDGPHTTANTASASPMKSIGLTVSFNEWFSNAILNDEPPAQRVLMTYAADLTTVLKTLFENVTRSSSSGTPTITWPTLKEAYQAHKLSETRQQIYRRIDAEFQQDRQIRDQDFFRRLLHELLFRLETDPEITITPSLSPQNIEVPVVPTQRIRLPVWYHLSPCFAPPSQHS